MNEKQVSTLDSEETTEVNKITEKVNSKTKRSACPYCDNINWFVINNNQIQPVLMLQDSRSYPAYTLSCTNCGFIRQHLSLIIDGFVVGKIEFLVPEE